MIQHLTTLCLRGYCKRRIFVFPCTENVTNAESFRLTGQTTVLEMIETRILDVSAYDAMEAVPCQGTYGPGWWSQIFTYSTLGYKQHGNKPKMGKTGTGSWPMTMLWTGVIIDDDDILNFVPWLLYCSLIRDSKLNTVNKFRHSPQMWHYM